MSASPEMQPNKDQKQPEVQTSAASQPVAARPSLQAETLKAFITSGVVILLTPLTISLTFFFTAALQSPKPWIEETSITLFYRPVPLSRSLQKAITTNPTTAAHLRRAILARTEVNDPDCVAWMKDFVWLNACAEKVRGALGEIADEARSVRDNPLMPSPSLSQAIQHDIQAIETLETEINAAEDVNLTDRTGDFEVNVGVYNSGSSDGVIKSLSSFTFEGKSVTLASKTWTPVKSHSFADAAFTFSLSAVSGDAQAARQDLQNRIKKHEEVPGVLEINMSEKIRSTPIVLSAKD